MIRALVLASTFGLAAITSCTPTEPNELDKLGTVDMTIGDQAFTLWVADSFDEQQRGLMEVTAEQMAPLPDGTQRGMIFVFDTSQRNSFWMRNTIIPLDIAYITSEGEVVSIYTMTPLDERPNQYLPAGAYRYAIEVNATVFDGLSEGDILDIPSFD